MENVEDLGKGHLELEERFGKLKGFLFDFLEHLGVSEIIDEDTHASFENILKEI